MSVGRRDAGPTRPSCIIKIKSSRVVLLCNLLPSTIRCTCTTSRDILCFLLLGLLFLFPFCLFHTSLSQQSFDCRKFGNTLIVRMLRLRLYLSCYLWFNYWYRCNDIPASLGVI